MPQLHTEELRGSTTACMRLKPILLSVLQCFMLIIALLLSAQQQRFAVNQHGDFVIIGNTLGHECSNNGAAAVTGSVGSVGACGNNTNDSAIDVFWDGD